MKTKNLLLLLVTCLRLTILSNTFTASNIASANRLPINAGDSLIFDLANATLTATYIDLPIYAVSDDVIFGIDYSIQFNQAKLTFSATIDLLPQDTTFSSFSYFNPNTLFLNYGGSTLQNLPAAGTTYLTKIRFTLSAPCVSITAADFSNISVYLNGISCPYRVSALNFSRFIPAATFVKSAACLNAAVQFSSTSTINSGSVTSWSWNFGSGITSALQNPVHTYTATGAAAATLIVSASNGCTNSAVNQFTITPPPACTISPAGTTTFCPNSFVLLSGSPNMSTYLWSTGAVTPTLSISDAGTYTLQVSDPNGCSAVSAPVIIINILPADFSKDGTIDISDFLLFLPKFGTSCNCPEDLNADGTVNINDFILFLPVYGNSCP